MAGSSEQPFLHYCRRITPPTARGCASGVAARSWPRVDCDRDRARAPLPWPNVAPNRPVP